MNLLLVTIGIVVAGLLGLLLWSTFKRAGARGTAKCQMDSISLNCKHVPNLLQIRQALDQADLEYLATKVSRKAARKVLKERRRIALRYLEGLREDFEWLVDAAQAVAALSPEVEAKEEWKRFRLSVEFRIKYRLVWAKFALGAPTFPGLEGIALMVSSLALDLERAVTRAAATAIGSGTPTSAQG